MAPLTWFVAALTAVGSACVLLSAVLASDVPRFTGLLVTLSLVALGNLPIVHVRHGDQTHTFNWSEASLVAGLVLLPAWWLPIVGTAVVATYYAMARRPIAKTLFNAFSFGIAAFLATVAKELIVGSSGEPWEWAALGVACAIYFIWNTTTVALAVALSRGVAFVEVFRSGLLLAALFALANSSVAILIAIAATKEPLVLLAVPPVLVQLLVAYRNTREVIGERDLWVAVQGISEDLQRNEPEDLPRVALGAIATLVDAKQVELLVVDGTRAWRHRRAGDDVQSESGPVSSLADDVWGRAECDRAMFWLDRSSASPRQQAWLKAESTETALVLPLEWGSQMVGLLRVAFERSVRSSQRIESILSTVGTQLASAITSHRQTETLRHQAEHDQLTNLPNRTLLVQHLADRLAGTRRTDVGLAVLFFDLDGFKVVNDSLGHHVGDDLLLEAARRLRSQMRPGDMVARFGGDEFVVVCDRLRHPAEATDITRRLLDSLAETVPVSMHSVPISASAGIAYADGDADPETLLRDADAAMYQAKRTGPGSFCMFSSELRTQVLNRLHLEADLRDALAKEELEVHYQPIVDVDSGRIREFEALARWHHPERGPVSPASFISVAEETGHIRALGEFVLRRACADMRRWIDMGIVGAGQRVAVNLSAIQLDRTLPTVVGEALARHGLPPTALTLEVTETALVDDPDAVAALERLRDIGVRVALDDFGTGYSSLSALRDLPVDTVKIDRSFVSRLGEEPQLDALVRGIVDLAHALEMDVVGEGVELPLQSELLAEFGCDLAQGWLHGRPMSPAVVQASMSGLDSQPRIRPEPSTPEAPSEETVLVADLRVV